MRYVESVSRVGITSRGDRVEALKLVAELGDYLTGRGIEVVLDEEIAPRLGRTGTPLEHMEADLLLSVGGDGTLLRALQQMSKGKLIPVLGINVGTIGFLTDVRSDEVYERLEEVLSGFEVVERSRLSVRLADATIPPAINEVVVITSQPAKMLHYRIFIDDVQLDEARADGVIIATPTGSTAYAMSAGGPIVDPKVEATVIVPLAPFKLSSRPWVVPADCTVSVELLSERGGLVVVDGQHTSSIGMGGIVRVSRCDTPAPFVSISKNGFYEKVRKKLS
ncbi:NAD(+)/NADH kinase [Methermicoccus shengliensis]|uniref:NAD kinase n=1 Tax=Methermicoccus shengliensis TaxID=660064 RepID=A0A832VMD1_9EURY|nr:NAD(+)/NADH kinase [Methermicoccus shengliensis]KUK04495.1 MAG: putative inorganic polyphosphate/ATP-NAD kinase [Euryarchaeota archaeon 55_53]KUK29783.1 MAG: putative inorganic polyphosphate/ATP-NAD kinase [Methanosarcinales archeaon 56_1174]MDI3487462.1 kinase [Methanosarcinales archaeon]MDN5295209.1 kinase [Methanosarcinales archaeon]HIH69196.1 NAD(+) kinase [Methermicoccus shengliensis]